MSSWTEKYRPSNFDEYIADPSGHSTHTILMNYLKSIIGGNPMYRGVVLHGDQGTGKTTMVNLFERSFKNKLNFVYCNASDERRKKDVIELIKAGMTDTFDGRPTVVVLDEAEKMKNLSMLVDNVNLIIIVNDKYQLNSRAIKDMPALEFKYPSQRFKESYIKRIIANEGINLSRYMVQEVAEHSTSYRNVARNLQLSVLADELVIAENDDYGLFEEVSRHFTGKEVRNANVKPYELLEWAFDNDGKYTIISKLDRLLSAFPEENYSGWKYVYGLIRHAKANPKPKYPYSWKLRYDVKREIEEDKKGLKKIKKSTHTSRKKKNMKKNIKTATFDDFMK